MAIYGLYSGNDGQSHLAVIEILGNGPPLDAPLPCSGWRPFQCKPGHVQSRGQVKQAMTLLQAAHQSQLGILPANHPEILASRLPLAQAHHAAGDVSSARRLAQLVIDHPPTEPSWTADQAIAGARGIVATLSDPEP